MSRGCRFGGAFVREREPAGRVQVDDLLQPRLLRLVLRQPFLERAVVLGLGKSMRELLAVQAEQHRTRNEVVDGCKVAFHAAAADYAPHVVARSAGNGWDVGAVPLPAGKHGEPIAANAAGQEAFKEILTSTAALSLQCRVGGTRYVEPAGRFIAIYRRPLGGIVRPEMFTDAEVAFAEDDCRDLQCPPESAFASEDAALVEVEGDGAV